MIDKTNPNPHKDASRPSLADRIIDAVNETDEPLTTWLIILGVSMMAIAFVLGLAAIWAPDDLHGKLGGTAALLGVPGVLLTFFSALAKADF